MARGNAKRSRAAACCAKCVPLGTVLLDQHFDFIGRLSAHAQPILDAVGLEQRSGVGLVDHRVVGAQFFQHASVARVTRIDGTDAEERAVLAAHPLHANSDCHCVLLG